MDYLNNLVLPITLLSGGYQLYAKRFYTPFLEENIFKVIGFELRNKEPHVQVTNNDIDWWWDVEDCIFITNDPLIINNDQVANTNDPEYSGYNPFK